MFLFIHLSDIHIDTSSTIDVSKLVSALPNNVTVNHCFIIFSGDFTQQSLEREFNSFDNVLTDLKQSISNRFNTDTDVVVVPGNHDIFIDKNKRVSAGSILSKKEGELNSLYKEQLPNQKLAIEYCKKNGVDFSKSSIYYKSYEYEDTQIHFVLVNSSPFSMLGSNDKDKGIHYLPAKDYPLHGNPKKGKTTIEVLVSHHRPDWFRTNEKLAMEEFEDSISTFCFYGHEHLNKQKRVTIDFTEGSSIVSRGGELKVSDGQLAGSFSAHYFDEENKKCDSFKYLFNYKSNTFYNLTFHTDNLRTNDFLSMKDDFVDNCINPKLEEGVYEKDLFIMPFLKAFGAQDDIVSFDVLINFINDKNKLFLYGSPGVGKSVLLHRLFEHYQRNKWCLLLDLKSDYYSNIETAVKDALDRQYKVNSLVFEEFKKSSKDEKIVFVDSFDLVKKAYKKDEFLKYLTEQFGTVIIVSTQKNETIKSLLSLHFEEEMMFDVCGFSIKQRAAFCEKYLKAKKMTNEMDIAAVINAVEASVATCSILDTSDPSYLMPLVSQIFNEKLYLERNTENAFSIIFEHSLRNAILKVSSPETLADFISIIQLIALHTALEKDSVYFDLSDIARCTKDRKKDFNHIKVTDEDVLNVLMDSKLAYKEDDGYRFERNSYLAYFASLEVIRLYQSGKTKYFDDVRSNIVHGINGDIFVFVVYQLKRVDVFCNIHDTLDELLKNFEEIHFEKKNNPILRKNKKLIPETKEQAENKKELYNRLENADRKRISSAKKNEEKAFEDKENEEIKALNKIWKLIEISCKAIAGFSNEIESETRLLFLEKTLTAAFKIVNLIFSFKDDKEIEQIEKDFSEAKSKWIEAAKGRNENQKMIKRVEELDIVHALYSMLTTFVLNFETSISRIMSSRVSLPIISNLKEDNFFKTLFKIITYAETGNYKGFSNKIKPFYDNRKENEEQILIINRVVRVFVIKNGLRTNERVELSNITGISQVKLLEYNSDAK